MSAHCCHEKGHELERIALHKDIRRVLVVVMMLNLMMFVLEFGAGIIADSAALMADSVDMLGDGLVYGISLYALNRSLRWRAGMALAKAGFILALGLGVVVQIVIKIVWGHPPESGIMLIFGGMALVANLSCVGSALAVPAARREPVEHLRMLAQRRLRQYRGAGGRGAGLVHRIRPGRTSPSPRSSPSSSSAPR